jgi:hypothetical protein
MLALLNPPKCAGCLFGVMTKISWHDKESKSSHKVFAATKPGETVSVDQMVSTKVGVFTKHAFEKFTAEHGVRIHHYHCDKAFMPTMPSRIHARAVVRDLPSVG